jgi:hypothetical protein
MFTDITRISPVDITSTHIADTCPIFNDGDNIEVLPDEVEKDPSDIIIWRIGNQIRCHDIIDGDLVGLQEFINRCFPIDLPAFACWLVCL